MLRTSEAPVADVLREPDDRVAGLLAIAETISSELDFKSLLKELARKTAEICGADRCSIYLWREGMLSPAMSQYASGVWNDDMWAAFKGLGSLRLDDFHGFKRALDEGTPVVFDDPEKDDLLPRQWVETFGIRSGIILALTRQQRFVGVMHLNNCVSSRKFGSGDVELARAIAVQLALVIDNARLVEETRSRLRDTETLLSVGRAVNSTLDLMEVVRRITRAAARALGADSSGVYLSTDGILEPLAGYHVPKHFLETMRGGSLVLKSFHRLGTILKESPQSLWSDDVPNDPRFDHEIFGRFPLQSVLITSLHAKDELVGVLVCSWFRRRRRFSDKELRLVEAIAAQAAIAIVNARLYAKAEELAVNRERVRVAQELHDRLSQTVFSLGLKLEWCLHHLPSPSAVRSKLEDVRNEARSIMRQMHHLIHRLSPDSSPAVDFPARLRKLVEDFQELSGIVLTFAQQGEFSTLGGPVEEILFKTLQEALANVVKHARAARVKVTLTVIDETVTFEVLDDGVGPPPGFGTSASSGISSHGLRQMASRIASAQGRVQFGARIPRGFSVRGSLPIRPGP